MKEISIEYNGKSRQLSYYKKNDPKDLEDFECTVDFENDGFLEKYLSKPLEIKTTIRDDNQHLIMVGDGYEFKETKELHELIVLAIIENEKLSARRSMGR